MTNTTSASKKRNPPDSISTQSKRPRHPPSDSIPPAANITIPTPSADQLRAENAYEHRKIAETCLNGNGRWALGSHCEGMLRDEGVEIPASQLGLSVDRFSFSSVDPGAATPAHNSDDDDDETCDSNQDDPTPIPIPQPTRPATILRKLAVAPPLPSRHERLSLEESQRVLREGFEQERARLVQTSMPDSEDFRNVRMHDVAVPGRVPCGRRASLADKPPAAERLRSKAKPPASPVIAAPSAKDATGPAGVVLSQAAQITRTPRDKENISPGTDDSASQSTPVSRGKGKAVDRPTSVAEKQVTSQDADCKKQSDGQAKTQAKALNITTKTPTTVGAPDSQGGQQQVVLATVMAEPQKESSLQGVSAQTHELRKSDESFGNLRAVARVQAQGQSQTQAKAQAEVPIQARAQTRVQAQPPAQIQPQAEPQLQAQPRPQAKGKTKAQPPAQESRAKQVTLKAKPQAELKPKVQTKTQNEQAAGPAPTSSVTPETFLQLPPPSLPNVSIGIDGRVTGETQFLQIPQMQMQMHMHALPHQQQQQQQDLGQNQCQIQGVIMDQTQAPAPTHALGASQDYLLGDVQAYGLDPMQQQIYEQMYTNPYGQIYMQPQQMQPWFEQPQAMPAHFLQPVIQPQLDLQLEPQLQPTLLSLGLSYAPQDLYPFVATPQQPPLLLTPPHLLQPQPQPQPHTDYSADLILQQNQLISRLQRLVDHYENEAEERAERCRYMHQLMHAQPEADEHAQTAQAPQPQSQPQPEDQQPGPTQPVLPTTPTPARPLAPVIATEILPARNTAATLPGFLQGASAAVQAEFHAERQHRGGGAGTPASVPSATTAESSGASSSVGTVVAGPATREMQALQLDSRPGSVGGKAQAQVQVEENQFRWVHWEGPPGR